MASITRANPHLEEIIQILDNHLVDCKGDPALAISRLSSSEQEWIDDEIVKCMAEPRYFISNYYAIRTEDYGFQGLYPLWDSQEILHDEYRRLEKQYGKVRALVLKARQMGSTTYNCAEFFHKTIFKEHANSLIVGQDQDQATFIMGMYESALDFIPWWMRPRRGKGCETGRIISFDEKDDQVRAAKPGLKSWIYADNANKPSGVGRGKCQVPWSNIWTEEGPKTLEVIFREYCYEEHGTVSSDGVGEWFVPSRPVYTWSFDGKRIVRKKISKVYRQKYRGEIQRVELADGVVIEKTPEHKLLSGRKWEKTFLPGDHVDRIGKAYKKCDQRILSKWAETIREELSAGLREEKVVSVTGYEYDGFIYDLEVEDTHNYPTSGVVTHNTFHRCCFSELAFWQNGSQLSKSLFPTMNTSDGFYIMESTANGRNDFWHNLWRRAEAGKIDWHPIFIPFYRREKTYSLPIAEPDKFVLTQEERDMRDRIVKKDGFLIKNETFNWMRNKKEEFIATDGDDTMFSQEYTSEAEESFQTSAVTAFPRGIIRKLGLRTVNPKWVGEVCYDFAVGRPKPTLRVVAENEELPYPERENRFHVWHMPERGKTYVMGVDVSLGNEGGDYSCVQVVGVDAGHELDEQVACWHGMIDPSGLAEIVFAVGWMYNEALAAVEVNSMGMVTNNELIRNLDYDNIYRFKRLDRLKNFMTDIVGWWTDEKSKRALMAKMSKSLLDGQIIINDKFTVDEFNDFTESGAVGEGAHDDFCMALMIALYCGHEGEIGRRQMEKDKKPDTSKNVFEIKDRFDTIIATTTSQNEAERLSKRHVGSSIVRTASATANVTIAGRKAKVPSDFQNTEHSPVHDKQGTAHRLHYEEGVAEEEITPERIAEYEAEQEADNENDPNSWLYS